MTHTDQDSWMSADQITVLLIETEDARQRLFEQVFAQMGYDHICHANSAESALAQLDQTPMDLIILDLTNEQLANVNLLSKIRQRLSVDDHVPILTIVHADDTTMHKKALTLGAIDLLTFPFDRIELGMRLNNHIEARLINRDIQRRHRETEQKSFAIAAQLNELQQALEQADTRQERVLRTISQLLEHQQKLPAGYTDRLVFLVELMAKHLQMDDAQICALRWGAMLHDTGTQSIPNEIIDPAQPRTEAEQNTFQSHVTLGQQMLADMDFLPEQVFQIIRHHHEYFDGTGFPDQLAGEEIPMPARIIAVANSYLKRLDRMPHEKVAEQLQAMAGKQLDPALVELLLKIVPQPV